MIERMPQCMAKLSSVSSRSFSRPSRFLSTRPSLRLRPLYPNHFQCLHKRFYAHPTPGDPKSPPIPADPHASRDGVATAPEPVFEYDAFDRPIRLERQPTTRPRPKRSLRPFIYATIFFIFGAAAGQYVRYVIAPPPLPIPGTKDDESLTAHIHKLASKLPLVQCLSSDPNWKAWDAYSIFTPEEKLHRITSGPLGGSRGLGGYQRIFYNPSTGDFISVVWIGGALAGWPGVAHGGLIATIMDESMGRCAIARFPVKTGVTANLEFNYLAPTVTNAFYVVRATPVEEGSTERKSFVQGRIETLDGRVCVEARGLFVLPKGPTMRKLKPIELKKLSDGF